MQKDPKHERLFINRMKTFVNDKTLVVVTHRKPILELTNRVIVVDTGSFTVNLKEVLKHFFLTEDYHLMFLFIRELLKT